MSICTKCGNVIAETDRFCNACGAPVSAPEITPAPTYDPNYTYVHEPARPTYEPARPTYEPPKTYYPSYAPVPVAEPVVPGNVKATGFIGMGLGIGGLVMAVIGILYTLIGLTIAGEGLALGCAIGFGIFSMPLSIVGRMLANRSQEEGNPSKACSVGAGVALGGLIVSAIMLFLGFIELTMI